MNNLDIVVWEGMDSNDQITYSKEHYTNGNGKTLCGRVLPKFDCDIVNWKSVDCKTCKKISKKL